MARSLHGRRRLTQLAPLTRAFSSPLLPLVSHSPRLGCSLARVSLDYREKHRLLVLPISPLPNRGRSFSPLTLALAKITRCGRGRSVDAIFLCTALSQAWVSRASADAETGSKQTSTSFLSSSRIHPTPTFQVATHLSLPRAPSHGGFSPGIWNHRQPAYPQRGQCCTGAPTEASRQTRHRWAGEPRRGQSR